jgi:lysophospholipase L1-like esterase
MQKQDWHVDEFRKLVTLGESITAGGWSTSPQRCWASVLATLINDFQATPVTLFNAGIGANVISTRSPSYPYSGKPAASERLDKHVFAQNPDLLVISYGLNDARGGTPLHVFTEELESLVRRVRERIDPLIVLLGPYYMVDFALGGRTWGHADLALFYQFNEAVRRVAETENCLFVDVLAANGETEWMVHYDGVHANDLGHRVIANRVFEVLAQNCSCLAKATKEAEKHAPRWRDESTLKADYGW